MARVRLPADAPVLVVAAFKDGVGLDYFENYLYTPATEFGDLPAELTLALAGARTVTVRVVGPGGPPVAGVSVSASFVGKRGKLAGVNLSGNDAAIVGQRRRRSLRAVRLVAEGSRGHAQCLVALLQRGAAGGRVGR